ncbi:FAD dependent oxidoreductase [Xylariomycetidae sp. FL2044]|nr:FAD dependent oxidoreductase [Xylariomycetidae sp. FL2044]
MSSTVVILGAGVIGLSTAHYLSERQPGSTIHLVDPSPELLASASGFAGGFLARDWFAPGAAAELGALSFAEHARLAEREGGREKWGYRRSTAVSVVRRERERARGRRGEGGDRVGGGESRKEEEEDERKEKEKKKKKKRGAGGGERVDVWCREGGSRADAAGAAAAAVGDEHEDGDVRAETEVKGPSWFRSADDGDEFNIEVISEENTVAQVNPLQLCQFLLSRALASGVHLHHPARALAIHLDMRNELSSVRIADTTSSTETDVPCTHLIIAAGAWSARVFRSLFPRSAYELPISSLAGHSLVVRSPRWTGTGTGDEEAGKGEEEEECHALFLTPQPGGHDGSSHHHTYTPEIFSRSDAEIYIAGLNSPAEPLPALPTDAKSQISRSAIARLRATAAELIVSSSSSGKEDDNDDDDIEVVREGLCFRPVRTDETSTTTPIVGRVPDEKLGEGVGTRAGEGGGVWVAAGHGPWGISLGLGTGKVMADMVQGRGAGIGVEGLRVV